MALLSEKADVLYNPEVTDPDRIVSDIKGLGFSAQVISSDDSYQPGKLSLTVCDYIMVETKLILSVGILPLRLME